jgi:hypothetical protein
MDPEEDEDQQRNPYEDDDSPESRRADAILEEGRLKDREDLQGWNQRADAAKASAASGGRDVDAVRDGEKKADATDGGGGESGGGIAGAVGGGKKKDDDVKSQTVAAVGSTAPLTSQKAN